MRGETRPQGALKRLFAFGFIGVILLALGALAWLAFGGQDKSWVPATAQVSGFGGQSAKWGRVTVYVRNETGYGVIGRIPAGQLNCRIGEVVAVEQAGRLLRGTGRTCRDLTRL
jgi:Na+/proline symporter